MTSDRPRSLIRADDSEAAFPALAPEVVRQAPTFVGMFDAQLRPSFLNDAGRAMVGLASESDVAGYAIVDFFTQRHRGAVEMVGLPVMLRGGRWEGELCFRHFTDPSRETAVRWSAFALRDDAGHLIGAAAFADPFARMQAERALRDQPMLLASILDTLPSGVGVYDRFGDLIHPNQRMRDDVGLARLPSPDRHPGARVRRGDIVMPGLDVLHGEQEKTAARLRAATELVGLGIYSWDPVTGALDWDDRLRGMWGLPPGTPVDMDVYEAGIHRDDLARVRSAIAACVDPDGNGRYTIEYRVVGRDDGTTRHIATSGRTMFEHGRAIGFIGAAIDVTAQRRTEAAVRASEAQFRSFAEHSTNLIWIGDPAAGSIIYRSAAFERIWGIPCDDGPVALAAWMRDVHPDDRQAVDRALAAVNAGEVAHFEYRIVRPADGAIRWLRDTSFPILDEHGAVIRIGGITEDLTQGDGRQVYVVSHRAAEARRLASMVRSVGYRVQAFETASAFLDIAPVLALGCVLVDLRRARQEGLSVPRELKARSITLPTIVLDAPAADVTSAVAAMKAGAIDYLTATDEASLRGALTNAMAECHGTAQKTMSDDSAAARVARLTPREREVLVGLVEGGTNKTIGQKLGISPRTVELHRAQVMNRLNANSLTELLQIALAARVAPPSGVG